MRVNATWGSLAAPENSAVPLTDPDALTSARAASGAMSLAATAIRPPARPLSIETSPFMLAEPIVADSPDRESRSSPRRIVAAMSSLWPPTVPSPDIAPLTVPPAIRPSKPRLALGTVCPARRALLNELPGELAAQVGSIGQRRPPEEVREVVVVLCQHRDYRAEELAQLLARNVETVRQNYLRPLLRAGRIAMTRPDKPNDPEQAYRAVTK